MVPCLPGRNSRPERMSQAWVSLCIQAPFAASGVDQPGDRPGHQAPFLGLDFKEPLKEGHSAQGPLGLP